MKNYIVYENGNKTQKLVEALSLEDATLAILSDLGIELEEVEDKNLKSCPDCDNEMVYRMFEVPQSKDLVEKLTCLECNE